MNDFSGGQVARITCASGVLAIAAGFVFMLAGITWTGCIIDCNAQGAHRLAAIPLYAASMALLVAGPLLTWRKFSSRAAAGLASSSVVITLLSAFGCILFLAAHH